ncbi:MAG: phospholipid/cholesterol/gamma-HCH transport system permease protein [Chthoniobacter sp.]|jgi:phospholipid/cholesterol/gamma-HCH transport system permease protein|nr:phospholipid/cholesterol/gamma-HCH transport system permease protein [Chthoniobacter sp.]
MILDRITPFRKVLEHLSSVVWLLVETVQETLEHMRRGRLPFRASIFFEQTDRAGVGSIPLIALVSLFLGLTMALLTGYQLQSFGTERLVPGLVAVGFTRELGPLITGIMVAARIGAAYTAELGTMTVAEEVEAIEAMGIGPLRFLVSPRVLAIFLLMPCLVVLSNLTAMVGAAFICNLKLGIAYPYFIDLVHDALQRRDIIAGVVKSFLFGLIIGLVACYKGLTVRGGAAGVGDATTSSVVTAITTVIGFDTLANIVLIALYD